MSSTSSAPTAQQAIALAAEILSASRRFETSAERGRSARMARMMGDPKGKQFTIALADQVLRVTDPQRAAQRFQSLLSQHGSPQYLSWLDQRTLQLGAFASSLAPGFVMPAITQRVRKDSQHVIVSAEEREFTKYLEERKRAGIRVNLNQLGEAVLGEGEASRRLEAYLKRLADPRVTYVSVKLSSIASQISLTGYRATVESLKARLRQLYRAAFPVGSSPAKFINLDMEEYRDLHLTVDVFREVLSEPEFESLEAGIVLQAYLPDSASVQKELTQWARERWNKTGAGIKLRLVKGANLAMEEVEASIRDWTVSPYASKLETDANYKRMLRFACQKENAEAVRVGVASHNLFDIAYALLLRKANGVEQRIEFEMLEGMANGQSLEIKQRTGDMLLYSPVVKSEEFESAVAYLVRRLDENTAAGSFLGALFSLEEGSAAWKQQAEAFTKALELSYSDSLSDKPRRQQNRSTEKTTPLAADAPFHNVADTDFSLPCNREWITKWLEHWTSHRDRIAQTQIPIVVGGHEKQTAQAVDGSDPSRPGVVAYRYSVGSAEDVQAAISSSLAAQKKWEGEGRSGRAKVLRQVAAQLANDRGETIGCLMLDGAKAVQEADAEISEAIDFANYYAHSLDDPCWSDGIEPSALGLVVVTPPWNFPYAIPAGGVLAALMAGNAVILKPAPEAVLSSWHMIQQLWKAGVPKEVLQFLPLIDGPEGQALLTDSRVGSVILTGAFSTAAMFKSWCPSMRLCAETSGKNAMIVTAAADVDLAVKDMVRGAFGHAGQKCSATSLALVEASVYDDPKFAKTLLDAASSLTVGNSWYASSVVTPLIREPGPELARGLTQLDEGESWLLEPKMFENNPCLWSPGIRMGVKRGSWFHRTECFGPVLGVMRVNSLDEAIAIQNEGEFGLTGGIHSLDQAEIAKWRESVEVGNAYINRGTTGAIVQRQPFGGWKHSCVGPGAKAGGPNYVASFCHWREASLPQQRSALDPSARQKLDQLVRALNLDSKQQARVLASAESMKRAWAQEFSKEHDPSALHGETNHFRYKARPWTIVRIPDSLTSDSLDDLAITILSAQQVGSRLSLSASASTAWIDELKRSVGIEVTIESVDQLAQRLANQRDGVVRCLGPAAEPLYVASIRSNVPIICENVVANGRRELLWYLREQAVSQTVHRYGNVQMK